MPTVSEQTVRGVAYELMDAAGRAQEDNFDYDIIQLLPKTSNGTNVTFTWTGNVCRVNGSSSTYSMNYIWSHSDGMPKHMAAGKQIYVDFLQGEGENVNVYFTFYLSDSSTVTEYSDKSRIVTVPDSTESVTIALNVPSNKTISNKDIEVKILARSETTKYLDGKIEGIEEEITDYIPRNILPDFGAYNSTETRGITYAWQNDKETCILSGTASGGLSYNFLWAYTDGFPTGISAGGKYSLEFECSEENTVYVQIYFSYPNADPTNKLYSSNSEVAVPNDANGISIRLYVPADTEIEDTVTAKIRFLTTSKLEGSIGVANTVSKMLSVGSSFMTGLIYINGHKDHDCSFENSPYGNVAIGLGIPKSNVEHHLMGSTGLLYGPDPEHGKICILDALKQMDLSPYDYILTQFNRPDMGTGANQGYPVGDLTSEAGDGSIVGGVLDLLEYMRQNSPAATLILVGAPPSSQSESMRGQYVFTAEYNNGSSIHDADIMMHRLAQREHFIFIDWEDLNLSYYYYEFCDNANVHPNTDAVPRLMGLYLARNLSYTNSLAKVLKADAGV